MQFRWLGSLVRSPTEKLGQKTYQRSKRSSALLQESFEFRNAVRSLVLRKTLQKQLQLPQAQVVEGSCLECTG